MAGGAPAPGVGPGVGAAGAANEPDNADWLRSTKNLLQSKLMPQGLSAQDVLKSSKASLRWSYSWGDHASLTAGYAFWFSSSDVADVAAMPAISSRIWRCLSKIRNLGCCQAIDVLRDGGYAFAGGPSALEVQFVFLFTSSKSTHLIASMWKSLQGGGVASKSIVWGKLRWSSSKRALLSEPEVLCAVYQKEKLPARSKPRLGPRVAARRHRAAAKAKAAKVAEAAAAGAAGGAAEDTGDAGAAEAPGAAGAAEVAEYAIPIGDVDEAGIEGAGGEEDNGEDANEEDSQEEHEEADAAQDAEDAEALELVTDDWFMQEEGPDNDNIDLVAVLEETIAEVFGNETPRPEQPEQEHQEQKKILLPPDLIFRTPASTQAEMRDDWNSAAMRTCNALLHRHASWTWAQRLARSQRHKAGPGRLLLSAKQVMDIVALESPDGLVDEYFFSWTGMAPAPKMPAPPIDTIINLDTGVVERGVAWKLRTDALSRYVYPAGASDPKLDVTGYRIVHCDIGWVVSRDGGPPDRPFQPDVIVDVKKVWRLSSTSPVCMLSAICSYCLQLDPAGAVSGELITCPCCMLTMHPACAHQFPFFTDQSFDTVILDSRFDGKLCCLCQLCFA